MKYGTFSLAEAEGLILAHAIRLQDRRIGKGTRLSRSDLDEIKAYGLNAVTGLRLQDGDIGEDQAARRIAEAIGNDHLRLSEASTGRVNIYAGANGLFIADKAVIDRLNRVDPAITFACLADHAPVRAGDMVATVKIIPLAVPAKCVTRAIEILAEYTAISIRPFVPRSVTLLATQLPSLKTSIMDKTARILEQRLAISGSRLTKEVRVPHDGRALSEALRRLDLEDIDEPAMIIIFGASAVADAEDVIPAAIRSAGGIVDHIGMPVDPGNLLVLGHMGDIPVIGAPGCARSPRENGFDWILDRIMAGETPSAEDITGLGVGGLLMEIPSRPRPREVRQEDSGMISVSGVLLAAGQARRMGQGGPHKLLAEFDGVPLVRRSAQMLIESELTSVIAVTGHRREEIDDALSGLDLVLAFNPDYASGLSTSLIRGISQPQASASDGVLVMLADMPSITVAGINLLVETFRAAGGDCIIRASHQGKRGNPIILPRATYADILRLEGDIGARAIIESSGLSVIDVDIGPSAHIDVDTPEAVAAAGGIFRR